MPIPENWSQEPGIYRGLPEADYHADRIAVSNSWLLQHPTALHLKHWLDHGKPDTPAMALGRALHCRVLEPESFPDRFQVMPDIPRRSRDQKRAWVDWAKGVCHEAAHENLERYAAGDIKAPDADAILLSASFVHWIDLPLLARVEGMHAALMAHPGARWILENAEREVTVVWKDNDEFRDLVGSELSEGEIPLDGTQQMCKVRLDLLFQSEGIVGDLKSVNDASKSGFGRACYNYRYFVQAPYYQDGANTAGLKAEQFAFLLVESDPPHAVAVRHLSEPAMELGRLKYCPRLELIAQCRAAEKWPGYSDKVEEQDLPGWAYAIEGEP